MIKTEWKFEVLCSLSLQDLNLHCVTNILVSVIVNKTLPDENVIDVQRHSSDSEQMDVKVSFSFIFVGCANFNKFEK